jgi:hypothetical protein
MSSPRIILLDIETAPLEVYTWGIWDQNVGVNQIISEWTILAFCVKDLGKNPVRYLDAGCRGPDKVRDDKHLLRALWRELDQADIVITQNGIQFDIKKIKARMVMEGMTPFSPIKVIDTKKIAKAEFGLTSNGLEWMGDKIANMPKDKHKKFPGFELWEECLNDNPAAWAEMKKYNIRDVLVLEAVYMKMRGWATAHPNVAVYMLGEEPRCGRCGSEQVQKRGPTYTQTGEYTRIWCRDCTGWSRTRYTENSMKKRRALFSQ